MDTNIDLLCFAAHPDDVELACGGTVSKMAESGRKVVIVDFTRGEMGTRGTPEQRLAEAHKAAEIMGVYKRINLSRPDGHLDKSDENVTLAIEMIRRFRPKAVMMNQAFERHPDHEAVHKIVRRAMFLSGLKKIKTEFNGEQQQPYRTRRMYSYLQSYEFPRKPDFYVDITDTHEKKMLAIKAYVSQVHVPGKSEEGGPVTRLSRPEFIEELEARAIHFGALVGVRYAEAFLSVEPLVVSGLDKLF